MSAEIESIIDDLSLLKRRHHYCEDTWYSCPKSDEGCSNDGAGSECDCGADEYNERVDSVIKRIRALKIVEAEQTAINTERDVIVLRGGSISSKVEGGTTTPIS